MSDASWDSKPNSKSVAGYLIYLVQHQSAAVIARTSRMETIHTSSTSSEIGALLMLVLEILWLSHFLSDLGYPQEKNIEVKVDSASTILLCTHYSGNHRKVKHILRAMNFIIQQVENQTIQLVFVSGEENTADLMTKNFVGEKFIKHREEINGPEIQITESMRAERDRNIS
jgi:hypothetical protein